MLQIEFIPSAIELSNWQLNLLLRQLNSSFGFRIHLLTRLAAGENGKQDVAAATRPCSSTTVVNNSF